MKQIISNMSSWNKTNRNAPKRAIPLTPTVSLSVTHRQQVRDQEPVQQVSRFISPSHFAVICAIALDEELYIDEWIRYHLLLGFNHIYVYDNSENNVLKRQTNQSSYHYTFSRRSTNVDFQRFICCSIQTETYLGCSY
jgi:hypothetical protein